MLLESFSARLTLWYKTHGRHDLPWQGSDPYRIWLSEIMLQQTQVKSVLRYYPRFLARFPELSALAAATLDDVLLLWSGLGYYSRARNLYKTAKILMTEFGGVFPTERAQLELLPGVGRSTAAAIAAFAFCRQEAVLDGNVKRVLARCFGITGFPGERMVEKRLWRLAEDLLPREISLMSCYTQGLMDLGATLCMRAKPSCSICPMADACVAAREGRTAELPTPRPKKLILTRHTVMLLATKGSQVWLRRRPPLGIWGGLLSLPEFETIVHAEDWIRRMGRGEILPAWAEQEHLFTHYRLRITPLPVRLDGWHGGTAMNEQGYWLPLEEAPDAGVPAPVRQLLLRLTE